MRATGRSVRHDPQHVGWEDDIMSGSRIKALKGKGGLMSASEMNAESMGLMGQACCFAC